MTTEIITSQYIPSRRLFIQLHAAEERARIAVHKCTNSKFDGLNNRLKTMPVSFTVALDQLPVGKCDFQVTVLDPTRQKATFSRAPVMLVP
jgi:hypothetical protein